jgi:hypothetical protein
VLSGTSDLRRLRFFVELARDLHFGRSAARQHVSQPTLSQQIKRLESELGVELFVRPGRAVTLTPAGARLLPEAVELLEHMDRFNAFAAAAAREARGTVHPEEAGRVRRPDVDGAGNRAGDGDAAAHLRGDDERGRRPALRPRGTLRGPSPRDHRAARAMRIGARPLAG